MPLYNYECEHGHELEIIESIKSPTTRDCLECPSRPKACPDNKRGCAVLHTEACVQMRRVIKSVQPAKFIGGAPTPKFYRRGEW